MAASLNEVRRVHAGACNGLLARRNVVAVGVGYKRVSGRTTGDLAIVCSVRAKRPLESLALRDRIPATVQGVPTDVVQSGPIFAQQSRTGRVRPAPGGVSIGHVGITAGTLGCLVLKSGNPHILSNNHVLANSNDASVGDAILQPGPADGGRDPADQIARLVEWAPIAFDGVDGDGNGGGDDGNGGDGGESPCPIGGIAAGVLNAAAAAVGSRTRLRAVREAAPAASNLVDCAIAAPLDPSSVSADILEIGRIAGIADGELGMPIRKSGRTTGLTTGEIQQVDVTAQVDYGSGRTATFTDQLMAGAMSQGGDSGSAILDMDNRLVGLLFAGSTSTTVISRIQNVFAALQVDLP